LDTLNIDVIPAGCEITLDNRTETINTLFPVVNFLKCVVTKVVWFSIPALTFHSDTLEVWWDL